MLYTWRRRYLAEQQAPSTSLLPVVLRGDGPTQVVASSSGDPQAPDMKPASPEVQTALEENPLGGNAYIFRGQKPPRRQRQHPVLPVECLNRSLLVSAALASKSGSLEIMCRSKRPVQKEPGRAAYFSAKRLTLDA